MAHLRTSDPAVGATVGNYRVEGLLARGGMGVVYRARDVRLDRPVALKILAPELARDELLRRRFLRESRLAASLDHPNVVPVYEAGESDGLLYIAMRLVEGPDLRDVLERDAPLDPATALRIAGQAASALDAAHERGLLHRDVKPENVLLAEGRHVYLADFGLSTLVDRSSRLTPTGQVLGTLDYVAPEAIEGRELGPACDVYALACLVAECLTGEPPYPRDSPLAVLWAHLQDEPPALSARRPELPAALDAVIARGLAKSPAARFASCGELLAAVEESLAGRPAMAAVATEAETRTVATVLAASVEVASSRPGVRLDPEVVRRVASRCLDELCAIVERHEGIPERVAGDGLLAVWGLPLAREDDAVRAARAAAELTGAAGRVRREAAALGAEVTVRAGADAGGVVAAEARPTETAGAPVQSATALLRASSKGEVLVGPGLAALLQRVAVVEPLARDDLDEAGRLVDVLPAPAGPGRDSPLVGRERELAALRARFAEATAERRCRLVALVGPPGIGKTRLALELASELEDSATLLRGRCLSYGDGITYWPIREIVRAAAGAETVPALERLLEGEADARLVAERVAAAVGLTEGGFGHEETFWAIRRLFETLARRRPLVVLLEDCHWAEPTLLELVEHVAASARDAPILLIVIARPELLEERPSFGTAAGAARIDLDSLAEEDASLLASSLAARAGLESELVPRIVATAEGNPLFLEQLAAMARDEPQTGRSSMPLAIHALLAARLDRLPAQERRVLECAAVEGVVFHVGPLAALCPEIGPVALGRHLLALTRKQLVQPDQPTLPGEEALRFRHALVREAAYESLTHGRRALLHTRFADALAGFDEPEFTGYHLEQAVRYHLEAGVDHASVADLAERGAGLLGAAAGAALGRGDPRAAARLLERASALLPPGDDARAELEIELSTALLHAGRLEEAEAVAARVERATGDARIAANACCQRLLARYSLDLADATAELRRRADDLDRVLAAAGDERGLYRLWHVRGLTHWAEGRHALAREAWERAAGHAERAGDRAAHVDLLCWLASEALFGPAPAADAIGRCEALLERVRDQPYGRARVLHPLAGLHAMTGEPELASRELDEANAILDELGPTLQFAVSHSEALVWMLGGDFARAEERLRGGYERLEAMGDRAYLSGTAALLARVTLELGRLDEAFGHAERAAELSAADDAWNQALWRGVEARVLAERGASSRAQELAREAVAIADRTDDLSSQGAALADLAAVLRLAGDDDAALEATRAAIERYERKGDTVSATRTRQAAESARC